MARRRSISIEGFRHKNRARHAQQTHMEGASLVQCDFMAVIDD
jgi:hypothetical protein